MARFGKRAADKAAKPAISYSHDRFGRSKRMAKLDRREKKFVQTLVERVGATATIIDVPCGDGRLSAILSQGNFLASIDYNFASLLAARLKHGELIQGRLINADICSLPFASGSADLVLSMRLLHHVADAKTRCAILRQLARVSRRWVAVSFYRTECWRHVRKRMLGKKISGHPIAIKSFFAEAAQCGLHPVEKIPRYFGLNAQTLVLLEKE